MPREARRHTRAAGLARALVVCAAIGVATHLAADDYPSRPIRLVVGFTAGGPTDIPARFLAERLSASLGRAVMVENKPGAGALLAALDVLSRPRDGHDLLLCTYFDAVNTLIYRNPMYKLSDIVGLRRGIQRFGDAVEKRMGTPLARMAAHYRESVELIESVRPGSAFLPALRVQLDRLALESPAG